MSNNSNSTADTQLSLPKAAWPLGVWSRAPCISHESPVQREEGVKHLTMRSSTSFLQKASQQKNNEGFF